MLQIIDPYKPFSRSRLWEYQRRFFEESGIDAWKDGVVPHYITSNRFTARAYAEIVFALFRDVARQQTISGDPIYIVELGGGSGRFAYHFLTCLESCCDEASFAVPRFQYVLTDLAQKNVDFWMRHDRLKPFVEKKWLDVARFDAIADDTIRLLYSGASLQAGTCGQPLILIANYFFDSIPQELFYVQEHQLYSCNVALYTEENATDATPLSLQDLQPRYDYKECKNGYFTERVFNKILGLYKEQFETSHVLFPHIGLRCLERLRSFSSKGFMLLSCDKGQHRLDGLDNTPAPQPVNHGSFSLNVNYHAIRFFYEQQGALSLFPAHEYTGINVACLLFVEDTEKYSETRSAYRRHISDLGPDDFFTLKKHFEKFIGTMSIAHLLAHFRLSHYDARFFKQCTTHLISLLPQASEDEKAAVRAMAAQIWQAYYFIGESQDLAFDLGIMCYEISYYQDAIHYFEQSMRNYPDVAAPLFFNLAACCYQLREDDRAWHYLQRTLALDPAHEAAQLLLQEVKKEARSQE